jgi:hypothetical protein
VCVGCLWDAWPVASDWRGQEGVFDQQSPDFILETRQSPDFIIETRLVCVWDAWRMLGLWRVGECLKDAWPVASDWRGIEACLISSH